MVKIAKLAKMSIYNGKTISYVYFKEKFENMNSEVKTRLGSALDVDDFKGESNQILVTYDSSKRIIVLGLGEQEKITSERVRRSFGSLGSKLRELKVASVAVDLSELSDQFHLVAAIEGLLLGNYRFTTFKTLD